MSSRNQVIKEIINWAVYFVVILLAAFTILTYVAQRVEVIGVSMEPTLREGDSLLVDKLTYRFYSPKRFDMIVFPYVYKENYYCIKRIIGLPGETIQIDQEGRIIINGRQLEEYYGTEPMNHAGIASEPLFLAEGEYFVLGDNRNDSADSRTEEIGIIHRSQIIGRAAFRIWPLDSFGSLKHQ